MSDSQRDKFEAWYRSDTIDITRGHEDDLIGALAYRAWQAAIESVVIELPLWFHRREGGQAYGVGEVRRAIEKAGVKCK